MCFLIQDLPFSLIFFSNFVSRPLFLQSHLYELKFVHNYISILIYDISPYHDGYFLCNALTLPPFHPINLKDIS